MNKLNGQNLNAEIFNLKTGDICIYRANKINICIFYILHISFLYNNKRIRYCRFNLDLDLLKKRKISEVFSKLSRRSINFPTNLLLSLN